MRATSTGATSPIRRGIPTVYKGIRMRSRTEAKVAAFFDELDWAWEYEPCDLLAYIPDFALHFQTGPVLVEVKGTTEDIEIAKFKLEESGWDREAIIISRQPGSLHSEHMMQQWCAPVEYVIGNLLEAQEHSDAGPQWNLAIVKYCISCGSNTFISDSNSWHCRACGANSGDNTQDHLGETNPTAAWAAATNRVQWRPNT